MQLLDWILIIMAVLCVIGVGFYFLMQYAQRKMGEQQSLLSNHSQKLTIYTIDKRHSKVDDSGLPANIIAQMPKRSKLMKMYFVKAKVGPQIMTFMVQDKHVYNAIGLKKNIKVTAAGIYITSVEGMKSKEEMKQREKDKKAAEKAAKKAK